jgi:hypothetical protein
MLIFPRMKGYLTIGMIFLAICMLMGATGCSEESGWSAGYGGMQLQQDGSPSVPGGTAPDGSGAVNYIPTDNR